MEYAHALPNDLDLYVLIGFKPVLSTGPCFARVNSKRGGYALKYITMLYKLRKKKKTNE